MLQTYFGQENVYLALQNNYRERGSPRRTVAIQRCGDEPYEVSLRFAGCNLRCGPCFASGYSWPEIFRGNRRVIHASIDKVVRDFESVSYPKGYMSYNWFRVVGGEPLLNEHYINFLFDILTRVTSIDSKKFNKGIIVQTNGIYLGRSSLHDFSSRVSAFCETFPDVKLVIELSIKGTNEEEFELLARSDRENFRHNINAYFKLKDLDEKFDNFDVVAIAGFGINESVLVEGLKRAARRITIVFKNNKPIYHPEFWCSEFEELYNDFVRGYVSKKFSLHKMPMYGLKDTFGPGYGWVHRSIQQMKRIYGQRYYDKDYTTQRNFELEEAFNDILQHFFYPGSQRYYSTLIS